MGRTYNPTNTTGDNKVGVVLWRNNCNISVFVHLPLGGAYKSIPAPSCWGGSRFSWEEVLQQGGSSLLGNVHLVFEIAPIGGFRSFHFPREVFDFCL